MRRAIWGAALVALVDSAASAEPLHTWTFPSGSELYALCLSSDPGEQGRCIGYIAGIIDGGTLNSLATLSLVPGGLYGRTQWCFPWAASAESVKDVVIRYLRKDAENRSFSASVLVASALESAWPCPRSGGER